MQVQLKFHYICIVLIITFILINMNILYFVLFCNGFTRFVLLYGMLKAMQGFFS
jgi:hypothetical protein